MAAQDDDAGSLVGRGILCFGASKGPRTWSIERNGPWRPGYWIEIEGGPDDGEIVLLPDKERIAAGLAAGDICNVLIDDAGVRCTALNAEASATSSFRFDTPSTQGLVKRLLRVAAKPSLIVLAVVLASATFIQLSPPLDGRQQTERCARLVSSGIEAGDREGAATWLPTCGLPADEAEALLEKQWRSRWGDEGPPRMVQGVVERGGS